MTRHKTIYKILIIKIVKNIKKFKWNERIKERSNIRKFPDKSYEAKNIKKYSGDNSSPNKLAKTAEKGNIVFKIAGIAFLLVGAIVFNRNKN